jgi:arsenite methyltransferase
VAVRAVWRSRTGGPSRERSIELYRGVASRLDALTYNPFPALREQAVAQLHLGPGTTALDLACGAGASFDLIESAIGPEGRLIGVDHSPDMLALAHERVELRGWRNVTLIESPAQTVTIPQTSGAMLLVLSHDVLRSPAALTNVIGQLAPGARVAAAGLGLYPWWAAPLNLKHLLRMRKHSTTYDGLRRPWSHLADLVPGAEVHPVEGLVRGWVCAGSLPERPAR